MHHVHEDRLPRSFEQMTPEDQELIREGLDRHPDPMVRLDCLKVFSKEIERHSLAIAEYITRRAAASDSKDEIKRLLTVMRLLAKFVATTRTSL